LTRALFVALNGDHTLGREESRSGRNLAHCDSRRLHIIAYHAWVLLGDACRVFIIGSLRVTPRAGAFATAEAAPACEFAPLRQPNLLALIPR
jgi:hypothetical protein